MHSLNTGRKEAQRVPNLVARDTEPKTIDESHGMLPNNWVVKQTRCPEMFDSPTAIDSGSTALFSRARARKQSQTEAGRRAHANQQRRGGGDGEFPNGFTAGTSSVQNGPSHTLQKRAKPELLIEQSLQPVKTFIVKKIMTPEVDILISLQTRWQLVIVLSDLVPDLADSNHFIARL